MAASLVWSSLVAVGGGAVVWGIGVEVLYSVEGSGVDEREDEELIGEELVGDFVSGSRGLGLAEASANISSPCQ